MTSAAATAATVPSTRDTRVLRDGDTADSLSSRGGAGHTRQPPAALRQVRGVTCGWRRATAGFFSGGAGLLCRSAGVSQLPLALAYTSAALSLVTSWVGRVCVLGTDLQSISSVLAAAIASRPPVGETNVGARRACS